MAARTPSGLARRLPDNPAASMLLAGTDVQAGRWDKAEQRVRALGRGGPVQVLQPALLAWIQLGRGQPDQALAILRPLAEQNWLRALNALHAGLIADMRQSPAGGRALRPHGAGRPAAALLAARGALGRHPAARRQAAGRAAPAGADAGQRRRRRAGRHPFESPRPAGQPRRRLSGGWLGG
ncbi:hypothetical protein [Dankookia sp. P2]|uniref:hypothetical protein n=1 Tax=Dankookia sp. P2 TaxID=3423955 RepID=UPI003D66C552